MAVREFDGTDDLIQLTAGSGVGVSNFAQGAYTMVALVKPTTNTGTEAVMGAAVSGTWMAALVQESSNVGMGDNAAVYVANVTRATVWEVCAITKASGTTTVGVHRKALGSGSWEHSASSGSTAGAAGTPNRIDLGCVAGGTFSSFKDCRIACAAIFNKVLSNGEIEGIETAKTTQSIYDLTPVALWDVNQDSTATAVEDLIGTSDQSAIVGTTVIADGVDDPTGWTFGLSGATEKAGSGIVGP